MARVSLKPTSKGVTVLVILAAVILFGCVLGYMAAAGELKTIAMEMDRKQKQVTANKEIALKLENSRLEYLDARSQVRCLEASVSTQDFVPTLLKQLEHLGKSVNLKVIGVRPEPPSKDPVVARSISSGAKAAEGNVEAASQQKNTAAGAAKPATAVKPYDEIKIDVQAQGKFMNALDFLYKLTSFPKIVAVNSVDLAPPGNLESCYASPSLTIKLNITAFVLKSDKKPTVPNASQDPKSNSMTKGKGRTNNEAG